MFKMPNSAFLDLHLRFRLEPVTDANRLPCFLCADAKCIRKLFSVVPRLIRKDTTLLPGRV